ncbi:unnamed protein product [Lymnaea stagnalis]|uniref:Prokineticin domain-containing protein n=1 Tax=Lymnaea stagnalis TaxID=6523 RepID=A0AAV2ID58_LYMST
MDLTSLLLTVACMVAVSYATVGDTCSYDVECDQGECCQILSRIMVVSKKRQPDWMTTPPGGTRGTCQLYQTEGHSCDSLDVANGYCSCEPGTQCTEVEKATTPTITEQDRSLNEDDSKLTTPYLARRSPVKPGYSWICMA